MDHHYQPDGFAAAGRAGHPVPRNTHHPQRAAAQGGPEIRHRPGARLLPPGAGVDLPPRLADHLGGRRLGGGVAADRHTTETAHGALRRPRPVRRGNLPASRHAAGAHGGRRRLGLPGAACRRAGEVGHLVRGVLVAALPDELRPADRGQELRAVHRQHHVGGRYGGHSRRVRRCLGRAFPRSLRQVQTARLPERSLARIPLLRQRHRLAAPLGRPADGPHAADARAGVGALRLRRSARGRRCEARSRHGAPAGHHADARGRQSGAGRRGRACGFGLGGRLQTARRAEKRRAAGRTVAGRHR